MITAPTITEFELPSVVTPMVHVADIDGIPVLLVGVELLGTSLVVRLVGISTDDTHRRQFDVLSGPPPISGISVRAFDRNGAELNWRNASGGGGEDGQWRIEHYFAAADAPSIRLGGTRVDVVHSHTVLASVDISFHP